MNTHLWALQLMALQGVLGAFDTLYHHELTEALAQRISARKELGIHALRACIYSFLFMGLSTWEWHGVWALILVLVFAVEIILTLWDFVIEDQTRLLPATERVTHTLLAINGGAFITLLVINAPVWFAQDSALVWHDFGWLSVFLALCGLGVGLSGIRDGFAAYHLGKIAKGNSMKDKIHFSDEAEHVLVTGATGFVGQLLVRALLADGQRVTVWSRNAKRAAWLFDGKVGCVQSLQELPTSQKIDVVVNLAGARILGLPWTAKRKAALRRSRVALTQDLVTWIQNSAHKPRLLLSTSAIGYYGVQAAGDQSCLDESSAPQNIFMSQLCQEWEAAAQCATQDGVTVCCMRFGLVLGMQGAFPMMTLPIKLGLGGAMGRGDQWYSWIHVEDVLRGIAHLWQLQNTAKEKIDGAYNFTAPEALSQKGFSQHIARHLHRPCFFPTPAVPVRLLLGEQADLLLEGQRVEPRRMLQTCFVFKYPRLDDALKTLL